MKALHLISGGDKGGAKTHVFTLLHALKEEIEINVVCFMEGVFYQELQQTDIPYMLVKQRFRNDLTIIKPLVKHIRQNRYDVIHAHGARANFICMFLRPFIQVPLITTIHSDYRMDFTQSIYKRVFYTGLNMFALRFMDYYVAVSNNFQQMLLDRGFDEKRIYTVYNTIDFDADQPYEDKEAFLSRLGIQAEGKILVGIIGRFEKVKGHEVFLKAAAQALKIRGDLLFLLAGEGEEQAHLQALAKSLGIADSVVFTGFINDIFSFINAIDMNVLTSYSESFPYVLLEGAKMRKATVSTAVGGIPDLIRDGVTGLLAPSGDYEALAAQILRLAQDAPLRAALGEQLYAFAKENFSKESMKARHLDIYHSVIARYSLSHSRYDIVMAGYYGSNNSGDEALLGAIVDSLRRDIEGVSILVISKKPRETAKNYGVVSIGRWNLLKIRRAFLHSRLFIYGGGSIIQDITSTRSLAYYALLLDCAKRFGMRVMLYANGIGPIMRKRNIPMARRALLKCDKITVRDPSSLAELPKLGADVTDVSLSSDPALTIRPADDERVRQILECEGIDTALRYVAISVRPWKGSDHAIIHTMAEYIHTVYEKHTLIPILIPMQYPYDLTICKEIAAQLTIPYVIMKQDYSVRELLGIISKATLVTAMRLHTLIYAVSVNVPVIGLVYDPKIRSFMDYIRQGTYMDIQQMNPAAMAQMTGDILANIETVKADIATEVWKLRELATRDTKAVKELLDS